MNELYKGHYENALIAQKKAIEAVKNKNKKIKETYNKKPSYCLNCKNSLEYKKRNNKFCGSSCSATYNNKQREGHNDETKNKISKKLTGRKLSEEHKKKSSISLNKINDKTNFEKRKKNYDKFPKFCTVCEQKIEYEQRHRKTCSTECKIFSSTNRTYLNGSRKTIKYNKIILESTWELKLAKWLDDKKIVWERPKPIVWLDDKNKKRLYYPDFYIPSLDLYVDPKNPYCMEKDKIKMSIISKKIKILYGNIDEIITKIENEV